MSAKSEKMKQHKSPQEVAVELNERYPISTEEKLRAMALNHPLGTIVYVLGDNILLGTSAKDAEAAILAMPPVPVAEAGRRLNLQAQTVRKYINPISDTQPYLYSMSSLEEYAREHRGQQGLKRTREPKTADVSPATAEKVLNCARPGATVREIAQAAGVSRQTVSNVLRLAELQREQGESEK